MNGGEYCSQEAIEIDVFGLFQYLAKKWRVLLISIIVGAIVALGINYYQVKGWKPQMLSDYVAAEITEDEIRDYNIDLIKQDIEYKNALESFDLASSSRLALTFDSNNTYTFKSSYILEADNYTIDAVGAYYQDFLLRGDNKEKIKSAISNECSDVDFEDVFSVYYQNLNKVITTEDGSPTPAIGRLDIIYYASEESSIHTVGDVVNAILESSENPSYSSTLTFLSSDISFGFVSSIFDLNYNVANERNGYIEKVINTEKGLSEDEIYYVDYVRGEEYRVGETARMHYIKYPVIGALILLFFTLLYYICRFILGKQIKTLNDIKAMAKVPIIACYPENSTDYISSAVRLIPGESILISIDNQVCGLDDLANKLRIADSRISLVGSIEEDVDAIVKANEADGIVLVVQLWQTEKRSLLRQLSYAERIGKPIMGLIVID